MTYLFQVAGLAVLIYGLVKLDVIAVIAGPVIVQCAKAWFIDRMVLLFDDMKTRHSQYADGSTEAGPMNASRNSVCVPRLADARTLNSQQLPVCVDSAPRCRLCVTRW